MNPEHRSRRTIPLWDALNTGIAAVWLINGLVAKVLGLVPRHREIVAGIVDPDHAGWLTVLIGLGEVVLAIWILSARWPRVCAVTQILLVITMNVLEFLLVPELLLWGRWNMALALGFVAVVYYNGFHKRSASGAA